ncbi:MAG: glycosyltransferase family 2 protein [Lachnospiraceae bacterium]|nr:glycosyltransferase family 2 protein [Lachnospiraceae bacterium]
MVSVIIPTYNRAKTIERSLNSVLSQTYKDLEVIIVDDGSDDNTKEVVDSVSDSRVRYYYQDNQGACCARNLGIDVAKGDYISFQDSDDVWISNKLEIQMRVFEEHKDADIVCCKTRCKRLNGSILLPMKSTPEGFLNETRGPFGISTQTLVLKKKVTQDIKFDPNVIRYQDLDFLLSAQAQYSVYCVDKYLVDRFIENDSITNHPERVLSMAKYFENKHSKLFEEPNSYISRFFAGALIEAGREQKGRRERITYYKEALAYNNSLRIRIKLLLVISNVYPFYRLAVERIDENKRVKNTN